MSADHSGLGRDLTAFAYVSYMCELADQLVAGTHPDPRVFAALCDGIEVALEGSPPPVVLRRFELQLLDSLGLLPTFGHCCVCGTDLDTGDGPVAYDPDRGGALCPRHGVGAATAGGGARRVDPAVLRACAGLVEGADDPLSDATVAQRKGVRDVALEVVRRHLRRPLKSLEFFAQLPGSRGR
jgi:DNA repair protein RecO